MKFRAVSMVDKTQFESRFLRFLFLMAFMLSFSEVHSQKAKCGFDSLEECVGNVAKLKLSLVSNEGFDEIMSRNIFIKKEKKYKPLKKLKDASHNDRSDEMYVGKREKVEEFFDLTLMSEIKGIKVVYANKSKSKQFLQCVCNPRFVYGEDSIYIAINEETKPLLKCMTNKSYFVNLFNEFQLSYAYYDIESGVIPNYCKNESTIYRKFVKVEWKMEYNESYNTYDFYYRLPEVKWKEFGNLKKQIGDSNISNQNNGFVSERTVKDYLPVYENILRKEEEERKRKQAIADSITDHTVLMASYSVCADSLVADTLDMYTENKEPEGINENKNDLLDNLWDETFYVYKCLGNMCYCITYTTEKEVVLDEKNLDFSDLELYEKVKARGENGAKVRMEVCKAELKAKKELEQEVLKMANERILEKKKMYKQIMNNQLFLFEYNYGTNDYNKICADFEFFNCFKKTIKYVKVTLRPYNNVGDIQRDYFGRTTSTVTMIGYVFPENSAKCTFNDLFYDYYGIIHYLKITNVTFIFTDGTKKVFAGWDNIYKHWDTYGLHEDLENDSW